MAAKIARFFDRMFEAYAHQLSALPVPALHHLLSGL